MATPRQTIEVAVWVLVEGFLLARARASLGHWPALGGWFCLTLLAWFIAAETARRVAFHLPESPQIEPPPPESEAEPEEPDVLEAPEVPPKIRSRTIKHELRDGYWWVHTADNQCVRIGPSRQASSSPPPIPETRHPHDA